MLLPGFLLNDWDLPQRGMVEHRYTGLRANATPFPIKGRFPFKKKPFYYFFYFGEVIPVTLYSIN